MISARSGGPVSVLLIFVSDSAKILWIYFRFWNLLTCVLGELGELGNGRATLHFMGLGMDHITICICMAIYITWSRGGPTTYSLPTAYHIHIYIHIHTAYSLSTSSYADLLETTLPAPGKHIRYTQAMSEWTQNPEKNEPHHLPNPKNPDSQNQSTTPRQSPREPFVPFSSSSDYRPHHLQHDYCRYQSTNRVYLISLHDTTLHSSLVAPRKID